MNNRGFTLIELLVAITLMVILTGSVVYIFSTGQRIFRDSDRQVQIFQAIRHLVDSIERELPIAARTHNMEFFADKTEPPNGQFEPEVDEIYPGQVYFSDLRTAIGGGQGSEYIASMAIHCNEYEDPEPNSGQIFRCDALYFRTTTSVRGSRRNALVCYCLETTAGENEPPIQGDSASSLKCVADDRYLPVLKRYVIYMDPETGSLQYVSSDLCSYVLDFRVEYFYHNPEDKAQEAAFIELPPETTKEFCYRGEGDVSKVAGKVQMSLNSFTSGQENPADRLSQIAPGDRILLYAENPPQEWGTNHNREYTIDKIDRSTAITIIEFRPGNSPPAPITVSSIPVKFRAGFLPGCIKMSFKICDERRNIIRNVTRYIKIKAM